MKKRFNDDNSPSLWDWTTKKLKQEAVSLYELIYGSHPCFGTKDIMRYDLILAELDKRGVEMNTKLSFN